MTGIMINTENPINAINHEKKKKTYNKHLNEKSKPRLFSPKHVKPNLDEERLMS